MENIISVRIDVGVSLFASRERCDCVSSRPHSLQISLWPFFLKNIIQSSDYRAEEEEEEKR